MRPQISYIIPAHNGERYLSACVGSITCQKNLSFEILIVENGSKDKTYEFALKLAEKDERIRVFQSEKGVSKARNVGIENARGEYLCFVDQDDTMLPDADAVFARGFEQFAGSDVYFAFSDSQTSAKQDNWHLVPKASMQKLLVESLRRPTKTLCAWGKLFSTDLVREKNIRFDPKITHSEDSDFVISVIMQSSFAAKIDRAVYHYTVNDPFSVRRTNRNLCDKYADAMLRTSRRLSKAPKEIKSAFLLYVLDHLLIVCVHDLFRKEKGSVKEQLSAARAAVKEGVYAQALKEAPLSKTSFVKATLFFFARYKIVLPLFVASKVRQLHNKTKYKVKNPAA
ncbi:MAG: glycosyltransferase [Oscillospiraceae bacterium]|nr:glycosyltransferase [Oscillospiraceae bacterium]